MDTNRDGFIKNKFKNDKFISEKANNIFKNFEESISKNNSNTANQQGYFQNNETNILSNSYQLNSINNYKNINNSNSSNNLNNINQSNGNNNSNNNVSDFIFYKRMNKFLSVAAVFLCVIVAGAGVVLYNKKPQVENINISTEHVIVKNEELKYGNEQILKESENDLVKVTLIGKKDVAIQLKARFLNIYNLDLSSEKQYKVNNVTRNVADVFAGTILNNETPCVLLLMEDGTVEYVHILSDSQGAENNYELDFYSQGKIAGLYNVIEFEQKSRRYSYSDDLYYYINAIRKDGKRKEIEFGYYNDWDDTETRVFNNLNKKYIDEYERKQQEKREKETITTNNYEEEYIDTEGDYTTRTGKLVYNLSNLNKYFYYLYNTEFYRVNKNTKQEQCMATNVSSVIRDNSKSLSVGLSKDYSIYITDENIIFNDYDVNIGGRVISTKVRDGIELECRDNGVLTILFKPGQLNKLGIKYQSTDIKENVRYNVYGDSEGVYNEELNVTTADAKVAAIDNVGPNDKLSIVYAKKNDTIVCIDLMEAIRESNFHFVKKIIKDASNVEEFKVEPVYTEKNGNKIEKYRTLFTIERRDNVTFYNREINYED